MSQTIIGIRFVIIYVIHFCLRRSKPSNGNILVKVTTLNMLVQSSVIVRLGARIEKGVRRVVEEEDTILTLLRK